MFDYVSFGDLVLAVALVCGFLVILFWIALLVGFWIMLRGGEEE
jgi:hypothetical protein